MPTPRTPRPGALSRRSFLIRSGMLGAAGLSLPSLLAACGSAGGESSGADTTTGSSSGGTGGGTTGGSLYFENWPAYIDDETVGLFEQQTGIDMTYTEAFNDNNEYFAKIQPLLGNGKPIDPDIIAPTYWLAARLVQLGWLDELPLDGIPNLTNLDDGFRDQPWDPEQKYSLPWQSGMTGIGYNLDATGRELTSMADLFDPAFSGKIFMLTEMRDTIGLLLLGEGTDPATITSFDDAKAAFDKLQAAKDDGTIRAFTGNDYLDDLANGNFVAGTAWSGDILQLQAENPNIRFVIPEEGGMRWFDSMVVPKGAKHRDEIAAWMNFVYDPVNAARIAAYVQYVSPVKGVREELQKMGGDAAALADNPLMFPDEEAASRLKVFATLPEDVEAEFDAKFSEITGA